MQQPTREQLSPSATPVSDDISDTSRTLSTASAAGAITAVIRESDVKRDAQDPFSDLRLSPHDALHRAVRMKCTGSCGKQRRYFCSQCIVPLVEPVTAVPNVSLPLHVHIVQSGAEVPQQSTAQHVALLAPHCATLWRPFPECADDVYKTIVQNSSPGTVAVL